MPIRPYSETGLFPLEIGGECLQIPRFCPHRGGRLDHGNVNAAAQTVTCPLHHSTFCLKTGRQLSGPPCDNLSLPEDKNLQAPLAPIPQPKREI